MRQNTVIVRRQLDARFAKLRPLVHLASRPPAGWIRAIRQGLGMNAAQLADRMQVSQPRIIAMEHGEAMGAVTLKTLQRAAAALNCTLVYALVPKEPLEQVVHNRALHVAAERIAHVEHTMRLENQPTSAESQDQRVREVAETLVERASSTLWNHR
jgi:predicted DNA-binding mobile mystery protein A